MQELITVTILFIVTSHGELGSTGKPTGIWLEELTTPYYALTDAGYHVVIASPKGGAVPIDPRSLGERGKVESVDRYLADSSLQSLLKDAVPLDGLMARDYAAVFFPGGHGPMFDLAQDREVGRLVYFFHERDKPIAAVCHGPAALLAPTSYGTDDWLFAGKKLTGFTNDEEAAVELTDAMPFLLEDELKARGGQFSRADNFQPHVIVDGLLITGQNPASSEGVARALIAKISGDDERFHQSLVDPNPEE